MDLYIQATVDELSDKFRTHGNDGPNILFGIEGEGDLFLCSELVSPQYACVWRIAANCNFACVGEAEGCGTAEDDVVDGDACVCSLKELYLELQVLFGLVC